MSGQTLPIAAAAAAAAAATTSERSDTINSVRSWPGSFYTKIRSSDSILQRLDHRGSRAWPAYISRHKTPTRTVSRKQNMYETRDSTAKLDASWI